MAEFTDALAARVNRMLDAFEGGQTIGELDPAKSAIRDLKIEVLDTNGESGVLPLSEAVLNATNGVCGRWWDESNSTYRAGGYYGSLDMLRNLPNLLGLGCYLVTDDRTMRKLDPTNHHRFDDGSPAALDGTQGQYMWCWRTHYFTTWMEGTKTYYAVSFAPIAGKKSYKIPAGGVSALGAGVVDRTTNTLCSLISDDPKYRGGGNQTDWDGTFKSQLGKVATAIPYSAFSTYARKRGEGWDANWYVAQAVTEYLFMIIMGTRNSQEAFIAAKDANGLYQGGLGSGLTNMPNWDVWGYYPLLPTSVGLSLGDSVGVENFDILNEAGEVHHVAPVPVFFGLKNLYGHIWKMTSGVVNDVGAEKSVTYVAPSLYAGCTHNTIDGLLKAAEMPRLAGYIKRKSYNLLCAMPTEVGGTASTYFCDNFWENSASSKGLRSRLAGASADSGANAGTFCVNADDAFSHTDATVSSPLCFFREDPVMAL